MKAKKRKQRKARTFDQKYAEIEKLTKKLKRLLKVTEQLPKQRKGKK